MSGDMCFLARNKRSKVSLGGVLVEICRSGEHPSTTQTIPQNTAHNALSLCGVWPDAAKMERQLTYPLIGHINSNQHGLITLKVTYLDLSFNLGS